MKIKTSDGGIVTGVWANLDRELIGEVRIVGEQNEWLSLTSGDDEVVELQRGDCAELWPALKRYAETGSIAEPASPSQPEPAVGTLQWAIAQARSGRLVRRQSWHPDSYVSVESDQLRMPPVGTTSLWLDDIEATDWTLAEPPPQLAPPL